MVVKTPAATQKKPTAPAPTAAKPTLNIGTLVSPAVAARGNTGPSPAKPTATPAKTTAATNQAQQKSPLSIQQSTNSSAAQTKSNITSTTSASTPGNSVAYTPSNSVYAQLVNDPAYKDGYTTPYGVLNRQALEQDIQTLLTAYPQGIDANKAKENLPALIQDIRSAPSGSKAERKARTIYELTLGISEGRYPAINATTPVVENVKTNVAANQPQEKSPLSIQTNNTATATKPSASAPAKPKPTATSTPTPTNTVKPPAATAKPPTLGQQIASGPTPVRSSTEVFRGNIQGRGFADSRRPTKSISQLTSEGFKQVQVGSNRGIPVFEWQRTLMQGVPSAPAKLPAPAAPAKPPVIDQRKVPQNPVPLVNRSPAPLVPGGGSGMTAPATKPAAAAPAASSPIGAQTSPTGNTIQSIVSVPGPNTMLQVPYSTGTMLAGNAGGFNRARSSARKTGLTTKGTSRLKIARGGQTGASSGLNIGI